MLRLVQNYDLHIIYFVHQRVKMAISCHPFIDGNVDFVYNPQPALHWQGEIQVIEEE